MKPPEIYGDFHNLDDENRIRLTTFGTGQDRIKLGLQLRDGMAVTVYMDDADNAGNRDDLMADAVIRYNANEKCWVADLDWSKVANRSDRKKSTSQGDSRNGPNGAAAAPKTKPSPRKRKSARKVLLALRASETEFNKSDRVKYDVPPRDVAPAPRADN